MSEADNREALAGLEAAHGKVRAAIIWGQACAHVNDPAFDPAWWDAALAEVDALIAGEQERMKAAG